MRRPIGLFLVSSLALYGCKQSKTAPAGPIAAESPRAIDPATAGSISGVVGFTGTAPKRLAIDMSADPACAMAAEPNLTEQYMIAHGRLANVYVYIKTGVPDSTAPASTAAVVLDQKGCRYVPHVVALQQGGTVQFRNSDPTMHNVHTLPAQAGNAAVDLSEMPMGKPQSESFEAAETMLAVRCNNHPWMSAFVNVAPNPYFAVTAADGSFTIPNLPPGTYTLAAVHEKLGEQDVQISVGPKATAKASFSFSAK